MNIINDLIQWLPASEEPLSSDVFVIQGNSKTWIFDVGCNKQALENITNIQGEIGIILSHFHPDHTKNLQLLNLAQSDITVYMGENTSKYIKAHKTVIVTEELFIDDGILLHIVPIQATHAKGSVILEVDYKYAFLGDAIYPTHKSGKAAYNAQLLKEEIKALESLKATEFHISHRNPVCVSKEAIIRYLKGIYEGRNKNEPYILVSQR